MKVGILGLAGAGKDTFAEMLVQELSGFSIDRYALPLKKLTCAVFGKTMSYIEDRELKEQPIQFRRDEAIEHVFHCLEKVLKFSDDELEEASHLYFENFQGNRAMSPREFQQLFGTEVVRKVKRNAWRDRLQNRDASIVVPDVRFSNEYCDFNILIKRFENIDRPKHESEHLAWDLQFTGKIATLDIPIYEVNNRKEVTLDDLRAQAKLLAKQILGE